MPAVWEWDTSTKGAFKPYSAADTAKIEKAYAAGKGSVKLNATYVVDFAAMVQHRADDPTRQRAIRRSGDVPDPRAARKRKGGPGAGAAAGGGAAAVGGAAGAAAAAAAAAARKEEEEEEEGEGEGEGGGGAAAAGPAKKKPRAAGFAKNRLQHDLKLMKRAEAKGELNFALSLIDDNLYKWEFQLGEFDPDSQIAKDLAKYNEQHGVNALTVRMYFDDEYPLKAPFVHVVTPKLSGGYVFQGGLCMSTLMQGWAPTTSPEALLLQVRQVLQEGSARINNIKKVEQWDEAEARKGFSMAESAHRNDKSFE